MRVHLHFPDVGSLKGKRAELNRIKAHLRERCGASVAEELHLKHTPTLDFIYDDTLDKAERIGELLEREAGD